MPIKKNKISQTDNFIKGQNKKLAVFYPLCLFFSIFFLTSFLIFPPITSAQAGIKVKDMRLGSVVQIGQEKLVKVTNTGMFLSLKSHTSLTMQSMLAGDCHNLATYETLTLTDTRDNKTYRVRKMPDNRCWMVDNLAYGGTTTANGFIDACAENQLFLVMVKQRLINLGIKAQHNYMVIALMQKTGLVLSRKMAILVVTIALIKIVAICTTGKQSCNIL